MKRPVPSAIVPDELHDAFRRHGIEGDDAFLALGFAYAAKHKPNAFKFFPVERATDAFERAVRHDDRLRVELARIVEADPTGDALPNWYQFFLGRKFREGSGKFFTPKPIARAMARLLPLSKRPVLMDPTCGGGTFLAEGSARYPDADCHLIGNDVDRMLVGLTELALLTCAPRRHSLTLQCSNIYDHDFGDLEGTITGILANPPFSLPVSDIGGRSELFRLGYHNSDAVFLDVCERLLAPGGHLVCLLPHSIVANSEFQKLRMVVEKRWSLVGVVTLPEGVFYMTGNTTTRADILHLQKKPSRRARTSLYFANAPTVGYALNSRQGKLDDSLDAIVSNARVQGVVSDHV